MILRLLGCRHTLFIQSDGRTSPQRHASAAGEGVPSDIPVNGKSRRENKSRACGVRTGGVLFPFYYIIYLFRSPVARFAAGSRRRGRSTLRISCFIGTDLMGCHIRLQVVFWRWPHTTKSCAPGRHHLSKRVVVVVVVRNWISITCFRGRRRRDSGHCCW